MRNQPSKAGKCCNFICRYSVDPRNCFTAAERGLLCSVSATYTRRKHLCAQCKQPDSTHLLLPTPHWDCSVAQAKQCSTRATVHICYCQERSMVATRSLHIALTDALPEDHCWRWRQMSSSCWRRMKHIKQNVFWLPIRHFNIVVGQKLLLLTGLLAAKTRQSSTENRLRPYSKAMEHFWVQCI